MHAQRRTSAPKSNAGFTSKGMFLSEIQHHGCDTTRTKHLASLAFCTCRFITVICGRDFFLIEHCESVKLQGILENTTEVKESYI